MADKKLQIVDSSLKVNVNVRYTKMDGKTDTPVITHKAATSGCPVSLRTVYQGQVLGQGATQRVWTDDKGNVFSPAELLHCTEDGEAVEQNSITKVFNIDEYQPVANYTDKYVIDKYYELYPDINGMKKDRDRELARKSNLFGMYRLWEYLSKHNVVARGNFVTSALGFTDSDGYIRAIKFGNEWGLEVGKFKEAKTFSHLTADIPKETDIQQLVQATKPKKVRMI